MEKPREDAADIAAALFGKDYVCAESVLLGIARARGIESEFIPGIASGFCSGIARTCDTCGAVSGGIIALGLCYGRSVPGESLEDLYGLVREFKKQFLQKHGSANCKGLIGLDLGTESGKNAYRERDLYGTCRGFVMDACRILTELMDEYERKAFE